MVASMIAWADVPACRKMNAVIGERRITVEKSPAKKATLGDVKGYQPEKLHNQIRNLNLATFAILFGIAFATFLVAIALDRGTDPLLFLESAALNLSTELFGAMVTFLFINLYWERRSSFLRESERQLQRASEELAEDMKNARKQWSDTWTETLKSRGLDIADLSNPEAEDMPIYEALRYLSELKRNSTGDSSKTPIPNPTKTPKP